jgi:hypothetical protein
MYYYIRVATDKFDTDRFTGYLRKHFRDPHLEMPDLDGEEGALSQDERSEAETYHSHLTWMTLDDEIEFRVEYHVGPKDEDIESASLPVELMQWLGGFFRYDTAQAHVHARFDFPIGERQSRLPLPLKTEVRGDVEIHGLQLRLLSKPQGATHMRLTLGKDAWYAEVIAAKRIKFQAFNPLPDVMSLASVVDAFLEKRTS